MTFSDFEGTVRRIPKSEIYKVAAVTLNSAQTSENLGEGLTFLPNRV